LKDKTYHSFRVIKQFDKSGYKDQQSFRRYSRQFNIDLAPKILFSKSTSVDELIRSGVSNYLEFQNISDNFFYESKGK